MQESGGIDILVTNAGINVPKPDTAGTPSAIVDVASQAAELLARIPTGRYGEPEDITGAVTFLLSEAATMITGDALATGGGDTTRWSAQPMGRRSH